MTSVEVADDRPDPDAPRRPSVAIPIAEHDGSFVRLFEGRLPAISMDMSEGYMHGTHLLMALELRVRNVGYNEGKDGELTRLHQFALEEVRLTDAFDPADRPTNVGGSAAGDGWSNVLMDYLEGRIETLDFAGEEIPERLQKLLDDAAELASTNCAGMGCSPATPCSPLCERMYAETAGF